MKTTRENQSSGQATAELLVMLIGLTMLVLGMIYVGGMVLNSNHLLLDARSNAQLLSRTSAADAESDEIAGWNYGSSDTLKKGLKIPFSANDRILYTETSTVDGAQNALMSEMNSEQENFAWKNLNSKVNSHFSGDFSEQLGTAREAAGLVSASGVVNGVVYSGFDKGYRQKNSGRATRNTFLKWFNVKLDSSYMQSLPANRVHLPSLVK